MTECASDLPLQTKTKSDAAEEKEINLPFEDQPHSLSAWVEGESFLSRTIIDRNTSRGSGSDMDDGCSNVWWIRDVSLEVSDFLRNRVVGGE